MVGSALKWECCGFKNKPGDSNHIACQCIVSMSVRARLYVCMCVCPMHFELFGEGKWKKKIHFHWHLGEWIQVLFSGSVQYKDIEVNLMLWYRNIYFNMVKCTHTQTVSGATLDLRELLFSFLFSHSAFDSVKWIFFSFYFF